MHLFFLIIALILLLNNCGGGTNSDNTNIDEINNTTYTQTNININNTIAIRFLNKSTFGATTNDIKQLQKDGVEKWLDNQISKPIKEDIYLRKMISLAKQAEPDAYSATIDEYLDDNNIVFNKEKASFHSPRYRMTSWFDNALTEDDQLRHKVAYALSQIIVESDFEPIFTRRAEALARYFDILYKNAFGTYKQLLKDISLNSGMGMFLTFNGNKKLYQNDANISVYPDENYARELMQLFSIGLNKLNIDGTAQKDSKGNLIPTYTQEDVNQLARVFTGWDLQENSKYGLIGFTRGDLTHPLEFTDIYHDYNEKKLLGETINANLSGKEDIFRAIDIIMSQESVAPYISKNLIMRLTKSNPSSKYIKRVATVFKNTQGDLSKVIKAIFLDQELWDDLQNNNTIKFKEPLIAYTQFLRAMNVKPLNSWYFCGYGAPIDDNASNCQIITNSYLFNDTRKYLEQGAGLAPSVFNFYDNDFIPNDTNLQEKNFHAPELQIQSDTMIINFNNNIYTILSHWEEGYILQSKHDDGNGTLVQYENIDNMIKDAPRTSNVPVYYIGADKLLLNTQEEYDLMEMIIDGNINGDFINLQDYRQSDYHDDEKALKALIEFENNKLTGGLLSKEQMDVIYEALKDKIYNKYNGNTKKYQIFTNTILPVIRAIVSSDIYMVE